MSEFSSKYPLFEMIVDGQRKWLPLQEAGVIFDCGWFKVEIGNDVIEKYGALPRAVTDEEKRKISDIADEYSSTK